MKPPLIQGIDYTLEEGKVVLSRGYHLKRGYCCNGRCRNCPYKDAAQPVERVVITGLEALLPTIKIPR